MSEAEKIMCVKSVSTIFRVQAFWLDASFSSRDRLSSQSMKSELVANFSRRKRLKAHPEFSTREICSRVDTLATPATTGFAGINTDAALPPHVPAASVLSRD